MPGRPSPPPATRRRTPDRARRVAFDALRAVTSAGAYANLALPALLTERGLGGRDAAFATELLAGTCRAQGTYDLIIARAAGRELATLQPAVLDLLRLGTHQVLGMRVAPHAAVAASVDLAAATVGERVTGLVNAVLRRIGARDLAGWHELLTEGLDGRDRLAVVVAHPRWVVDAYADLLPADELPAALAANNIGPEPTFAIRPGLLAVADLVELGGRSTPHSPFGATGLGRPGDLALVRDGVVGVQDEGSQLVAWGLTRPDAVPGRWLDLCAGPGGKTALLAGLAAADGSTLLAADASEHRAALVAGAVRAYGRDAPTVVVADGIRPPWRDQRFTRVLADVPCSGLGALRRRPEARWRRGPGDVEQLHGLQRALLESAISAAGPGGVVAYVTCSPHRRETVDVVEDTLALRDDLEVLPASRVLPELPRAERGPYLQLWPHRHGTDAMFAAYLRRRR